MKPEAGPGVISEELGHGSRVPLFGAPADETLLIINDLGLLDIHDVLLLTVDADPGHGPAYRAS